MLWVLFVLLLLLWLLSGGFHMAGTLIRLVLVVALAGFLVELITGRRATV
ncbi:MAG: DUF5670 family protein [Acidobacteriia bacterium]|nr:DUF5670 family protein [Terriglobia bacterium]